MPTTSPKSPSPVAIELTDGTRLGIGPQGSQRSEQGVRTRCEARSSRRNSTRTDSSSRAHPCFQAPTSPRSRRRWFETGNLTPSTKFSQEQTTFISFTQYGSGVSVYDPGSPNTASLGNEQLKVDSSGGTTVVVWPRSLTHTQQRQVFDYADRQGWGNPARR